MGTLCLTVILTDRLRGINSLRDQLRIAGNPGACGGLSLRNVVLASKFFIAETVTDIF